MYADIHRIIIYLMNRKTKNKMSFQKIIITKNSNQINYPMEGVKKLKNKLNKK